MAIDNLPNGSDESRLSGAYIRTFVKQLATSKPLNTTENVIKKENSNIILGEYKQSISLTTKKGEKLGMAKLSNNQQSGHKKQVRRRLHTSRPYQDRLLNMAEARKEIVTALKFHRAAMKQANEQRKQQQQQAHQSIFGVHNYETSNVKRENTNNVELADNYCYYHPSKFNTSSYTPFIEPSPTYESIHNIPLPNQTLGLNLNLQAFTNLDTNFCTSIHTNNNTTSASDSKYTNSSLSPSSSSSTSAPNRIGGMATEVVGPSCGVNNENLHSALDEEEMAEIRSIGEQHQIEWDDTLNLVKSAWWFKVLKTVDIGKEMNGEEDFCYYNNNNNINNDDAFGELMEFPPWLSANNDQSYMQQHLDDSCSEDTTLPWMDIGDIEGLDDDWLS